MSLSGGSGSWSSLSDRDLKENFQTVDSRRLLETLSQVPVSTWNYKAQAIDIRHIGPMAQDFSAAFGVGEPLIGVRFGKGFMASLVGAPVPC